ncbi:MAG: DNA polymerase III subunit epsilon [Gammaproteobacteria bacterium]|nr:DNA polymerase III subunit epsilon [Gammaproteobacteria bacterium]MBU6509085.1 DNA polymerase III subunit epsilon [Gammaproteobacteria bacterium]MDE1983378.1 DNA polymerase III subunit epsilon [Gammaproteobacteria bacterium]MDE2108210.1 DNA polymerase III subunit epsilon [Gammaproteobacteria bacterium]MDE2461553.1 DNA polymerase III subunit epsilon [Gammaproteobacteria bacterium]
MRQIVLDTETTGLEPGEGHRIIEIGCIELLDRRVTQRVFHQYLNPERAVDAGAAEVHNLDDKFLADKPRFAQIAAEFLKFVEGAELVIHNAAFDMAFLNSELRRLGDAQADLGRHCRVLDTLELARRLHPGQKNSLDALCKRYHVDNTAREVHGALLDAQLLAEVYLAMTGGQASLSLDAAAGKFGAQAGVPAAVDRAGIKLTVVHASEQELEAHRERLAAIRKRSGGKCLWPE